MPLNISDAYSSQFSQFVKFAEDQTNAATSKTIARLGPSDGTLATRESVTAEAFEAGFAQALERA